MHKRVVIVVAGALFALLAVIAAIVTDLLDREFPQAIGVQNRVGLDFSGSRLGDTAAFARLAELDARWALGLVKVAPDLVEDRDAQIFVGVNDSGLPAEFQWFGGGTTGKVVGPARLVNSYPNGSYLVTGDDTHLAEFLAVLGGDGVKVRQSAASVGESLEFVVQEGSFLAAVLAVFALIAAMALFWLSMKARGRALRVLGGSPSLRIQVQDLGGFLGALLISATVVTILASGYVGLVRDWVYVPVFLKALVGLEVAVIAASLLAAVAMSASAWPSATMLATRQPAVRSLRSAAVVIQALTFLLVVGAAGPAWAAYQNSAATAAEAAQWKRLADQVGLVFPIDMVSVEPRIGQMIKDAESVNAVAVSYTFEKDSHSLTSPVSLVNQRWLDLMASGSTLTPVPYSEVENTVVPALAPQFDLFARAGKTGAELLSGFQYLRPANGFKLPVAGGGGGNLQFSDDVLVAVMPSVHAAIDDSNLTSMVSTLNVMFTGLAPTQQLLARNGLDTPSLRVVYVAEDGILRAQFAAYVVWLLNLALVALAIAFAVSAGVSALITALLNAKRDFPLRVAGLSWARILQSRVAREVLVGVGLALAVLLVQRPDLGAILVAAGFGLVVVPLSHLITVRWCFVGVGRRRM
ncbi:hypothetical protein LWC34_34870 [Kibdelosporangium philippinense]|uniref:Uncharacterized protein n=1 Tax=Kibdelosporangium philippinense TaxID=211113 RepID=A0ABS8ZK92_9PSEU|nr:hypothetical protein [Kibdelosporangium philippinense]MCE7007967.1 hypothetical protein [Kibdelosporangium philippinense]